MKKATKRQTRCVDGGTIPKEIAEGPPAKRGERTDRYADSEKARLVIEMEKRAVRGLRRGCKAILACKIVMGDGAPTSFSYGFPSGDALRTADTIRRHLPPYVRVEVGVAWAFLDSVLGFLGESPRTTPEKVGGHNRKHN